MAKIHNLTAEDIALATGHVVPASGELVTDNATILLPDHTGMLQGLVGSGQIVIELDPDPQPEPAPEPLPAEPTMLPPDLRSVDVVLMPTPEPEPEPVVLEEPAPKAPRKRR